MTGPRRYSADLLQGGLEIPCKLIFSGIAKDIEKVTRLLRLTEGEENTARYHIIVNKSPSTLIKAVKLSNASVAVKQHWKSSILPICLLKLLSLLVHQFISNSSHSNVEGSV